MWVLAPQRTFSPKATAWVYHQGEEFSEGQKKVAPHFLRTVRSEALYNILNDHVCLHRCEIPTSRRPSDL